MTIEKLKQQIVEKTQENITSLDHVLAIQDTTEINYQAHVNKVADLGTVGNGTDIGFFLHPMLIMDAKNSRCLGLGAVHHWNRTKSKSPEYSKLPIEEKESWRWLETAMETQKNLSHAKLITVIADRESDIYEEWYRIPNSKTHLLTRCCRDRVLIDRSEKLFEYTDTLPVKSSYTLDLPARPGKRSSRKTQIELRFDKVTLKKPQKCSDLNAPEMVEVHVVDVREKIGFTPKGEEPIHWRLLTTHEIYSVEDAKQIVGWYRQRWNIEQLFRTLKRQGLNIESSQVEQSEPLIKLCMLALQVAVQTLQLTLARDGNVPSLSEEVFSPEEKKLLSKLQTQLEGKTQKQKNNYRRGTLAWATWIIARLGGWKGYQSESPPGPITILNGINEFHILFAGWSLHKNLCA